MSRYDERGPSALEKVKSLVNRDGENREFILEFIVVAIVGARSRPPMQTFMQQKPLSSYVVTAAGADSATRRAVARQACRFARFKRTTPPSRGP